MNLGEYLKDDGIKQRLMVRMQNEYAATCVANFALDEVGTLLEQEISSLRQQNADLTAKTTNDHDLVKVLRREIDDLKVKLGERVSSRRRKTNGEDEPRELETH